MPEKANAAVAFAAVLVGLAVPTPPSAADPPAPGGPHPRLFMTAADVGNYARSAQTAGSAAAGLVARCQQTIDAPQYSTTRGGADGDTWPGNAVACAFAYRVTSQAKYLTQALQYWNASLNDDQTIGDGLGCTVSSSTYDWKNLWNGSYPPPALLLTVSHDTGYPMRWYGPYLALVYDWLHDAPGVDDILRAQARACLTAWIDNYSLRGYLNAAPGHNYHAGFVAAKVLAAVAIGNDGGADGHLWTEAIHEVFEAQLVGAGLADTPPGILVGGDWGSWQYGPLSVAEYAIATRALEENGVPQPAMDAWLDSLQLRNVYAQLPTMGEEHVGTGDFDGPLYHRTSALQLDAVLLGPSSDVAAGWAAHMKSALGLRSGGFYGALAENRAVTPQDYRAQVPAPPLWYVARGTGTMFARTSWASDALWAVFASPSMNGGSERYGPDHAHYAASNFVFSRGADHLVVDTSNYGEASTLETNALSADAMVDLGDYLGSQTPWGVSNLAWARAAGSNVFAARSDIAHAFDWNDGVSDIPFARRDWAFLPEGEIVTIDRVHTSWDPTLRPEYGMYVNLHTNTGGSLAPTGDGYVGTVGNSRVAIHEVLLSNGVPTVRSIAPGSCTASCAGSPNCAACTASRLPVDEYSVKVIGTWAVAIHVIDGLGASEAPAMVASLNDPALDPPPQYNAGIIGASVFRSSLQSYVAATSARDGEVGASMSYRTPGASAARHVVFDAPEASDGTSSVTASASSGNCVVAIAAGSGGGLTGRPLMFSVASAADGCAVTDTVDVPPGVSPPPGGGGTGGGPGGGAAVARGSGCSQAGADAGPSGFLAAAALAWLALRRRRERTSPSHVRRAL